MKTIPSEEAARRIGMEMVDLLRLVSDWPHLDPNRKPSGPMLWDEMDVKMARLWVSWEEQHGPDTNVGWCQDCEETTLCTLDKEGIYRCRACWGIGVTMDQDEEESR